LPPALCDHTQPLRLVPGLLQPALLIAINQNLSPSKYFPPVVFAEAKSGLALHTVITH
jgi:hypothetical protein